MILYCALTNNKRTNNRYYVTLITEAKRTPLQKGITIEKLLFYKTVINKK